MGTVVVVSERGSTLVSSALPELVTHRKPSAASASTGTPPAASRKPAAAAARTRRTPENYGVRVPSRPKQPTGGSWPVRFGLAELVRDLDRPSGWQLMVDGTPQSYVDPDDPSYLEFEYVR